MGADSLRKLNIKFVILIIIILSFSYAIFILNINIFQEYFISKNLNLAIYSYDTIMGGRICIVILSFNLLNKLQNRNYQCFLLATLIILLLIIPSSEKTYEFISGFSATIVELGRAWFQLYIPPLLRSTFSGLLTALAGLIRIISISLETNWTEAVFCKHIFALISTVCVFLFIHIRLKIDKIKQDNYASNVINIDSILRLISKHPYVFFVSFIAGFNNGMFNYTFIFGAEALTQRFSQNYQYSIYAGTMIFPIIIGRIADKHSVFLVNMYAVFALTLCNFIDVAFTFTHIKIFFYYFVAFIEAGLTASLYALSASIVGKTLYSKNFFRSFALSGLIIIIGSQLYNRLYHLYPDSFMLTKLIIGFMNILFLFPLCVSYKHVRDK